RKNSPKKEHLHGSDGTLLYREYRRSPHCDRNRFPKECSSFLIYVTPSTKGAKPPKPLEQHNKKNNEGVKPPKIKKHDPAKIGEDENVQKPPAIEKQNYPKKIDEGKKTVQSSRIVSI